MVASINERTPPLKPYLIHTTEAKSLQCIANLPRFTRLRGRHKKRSFEDSPYNLIQNDPEKQARISTHRFAIPFFKAIKRFNPPKRMKHRNKRLKRVQPKLMRLVCRVVLGKSPAKEARKPRCMPGHSYGQRAEDAIVYHIACYEAYFGRGNVRPARATLGKGLDMHTNTIDIYLALAEEKGRIKVVSGKENWTSNSYQIGDPSDLFNIRTPEYEGFDIPRGIKHGLIRQAFKERCIEVKNYLFALIKLDFVNNRFHLYKNFAKKNGKTSFEEQNKESSTIWTRSKFDSGTLDPPNECTGSNLSDSIRYNHARLERVLDEAEAKKPDELGVLLPPEFIEILDHFGYAGELDNAMLHQKKRLANDWNTNPIQVEKVLRHMQRKDLHNHKRKNFWGFFNHLMSEEKVGYHAMRVKECRDAIDGKKTRLDEGVDTRFIVDSIRDKEKRSGSKISNYLLEKLIRKPSEFARTALEAVNHRMKLMGTKDKKVESPFGLLNSVLKMPSVEAIRANFYYKKRAV
jgi:hypothetical protein